MIITSDSKNKVRKSDGVAFGLSLFMSRGLLFLLVAGQSVHCHTGKLIRGLFFFLMLPKLCGDEKIFFFYK